MLAVAATAAACLAALAAASPAMANLQEELAAFSDCPVEAPGVTTCVVSRTTGGEYIVGHKHIPIEAGITLQGGLTSSSNELVPAVDGNTLSEAELPLPGGLVGIEFLPPLTEVHVIPQLAGPVTVNLANLSAGEGVAMSVPLQVKIMNVLLGNACYIGSKSAPLAPQLTTGTTSPPAPAAPISGSTGTASGGKVVTVSGVTLVDNAFSAPGATGCGGIFSWFVDPAVDFVAGIPAHAGHNLAILHSELEIAPASLVKSGGESPLPAIGKCEKVEGGGAGYTDKGCVHSSATEEGEYEWIEGPGPEPGFTITSKSVKLETVGGEQVKCNASSGSGEFTSAKTATLTVALTGCELKSIKEACQSPGAAAGEIVVGPLDGTLGFVEGNPEAEEPEPEEEGEEEEGEEVAVSVGLQLSREPAFLTAECGAAAETLSVTGSVIGTVTPINKMATKQKIKFNEKNGEQSPQQFEGEPKATLTAAFGAGLGEEAGLKVKATIESEESSIESKVKLEVKATAD